MRFEELKDKALAADAQVISEGRGRVLVGTGTCGLAAGAGTVADAIGESAKQLGLDLVIQEVGCLGLCYAEPLVELQRPGNPSVLYGNLASDGVDSLVRGYFGGDSLSPDAALAVTSGESADGIPAIAEHPMFSRQVRIVLRNCGVIDPESIDQYVARGGYAGLSRALQMAPQDVIEEVKKSGLRGRGGAGFPTGMKWDFCRRAPGGPKYMICNADEGDPGAFMDRAVVESDPHSVLEGMAIAAFAIGAEHGYIYVRAEYPLAIRRLETAMRQAEEHGLLGANILGSGFSLSLKLKKGAGAFVCGEETALMASIEGERGMPRSRPPFPAQRGLFGKPTNINNVETLANLPEILARGGDWFAGFGTEKSRGTKTFALAGKIVRTGLIEVPLGITLREIVFDVGGGIPDDKQVKAVQTGGPSGGCIPAAMFDMPVDYEKLAEAGAIMGSGGMVVVDEDTCMVDMARYFLDFTQKESCGKCVPCRLGTKQMLQILTDISQGKGKESDIALLHEICEAVKLGSLCGLGQTAPNPVLTTLRYYPDEYEAHIGDGRCPAGACQALLRYTILETPCVGCGACARKCPVEAIAGERKKPHTIDQEKCIHCGICLEACRFDAVEKT